MDGAPDPNIHHDFTKLLALGREELVVELVDCATNLANLSERIGFLRAEEIREPRGYAKMERVQHECGREAYVEKKWVLIRLLDDIDRRYAHG